MVKGAEVAGFPDEHGAFEVMTHRTTSLFAGLYVYVAFVAPATFAAFTLH